MPRFLEKLFDVRIYSSTLFVAMLFDFNIIFITSTIRQLSLNGITIVIFIINKLDYPNERVSIVYDEHALEGLLANSKIKDGFYNSTFVRASVRKVQANSN